MNTIKLELPDGRLVCIQGGSAEGTARLIANHYLGAGPTADFSHSPEEPLEATAPTSGKPAPVTRPAFVANEEPLGIPAMQF